MNVTDYPLTSVNTYPLHGWDYHSLYACQRPEDSECSTYDWRCPACLLAAQASIQRFGDHEIQWRRDAECAEQPVMLSWLIDRSIYWLTAHTDGAEGTVWGSN